MHTDLANLSKVAFFYARKSIDFYLGVCVGSRGELPACLYPPLAWSALPGGTHSLALIVDDPDAPRGTYVHWVLFNVPPGHEGLSEGVQDVGVQGRNNAGSAKYAGPCPPPGPAHRYFFKLYALDTELSLNPGATKVDVERALEGHILAQGELMGRYRR
jgi:Raf kinase inhibitor-like YbhB/YbcL family protein